MTISLIACVVLTTTWISPALSSPMANGVAVSLRNSLWHVPIHGHYCGDQIQCGSTLISRDRLLTAGHCKKRRFAYEAHFGGLQTDGKDAADKIRVAYIVVHPLFDHSPDNEYDIAMVTLAYKILSSPDFKPIQFNMNTAVPNPKDQLTLVGNGLNDRGSNVWSRQMMRAKMTNKDCVSLRSKGLKDWSKSHICLAFDNNANGCLGDDGSGLVRDGRLLVGVMTRVSNVCKKLRSFNYMIRTSFVSDWIVKEVNRNTIDNVYDDF